MNLVQVSKIVRKQPENSSIGCALEKTYMHLFISRRASMRKKGSKEEVQRRTWEWAALRSTLDCNGGDSRTRYVLIRISTQRSTVVSKIVLLP